MPSGIEIVSIAMPNIPWEIPIPNFRDVAVSYLDTKSVGRFLLSPISRTERSRLRPSARRLAIGTAAMVLAGLVESLVGRLNKARGVRRGVDAHRSLAYPG